METKTINFFTFTAKVRKTKTNKIINGKVYTIWKSTKRSNDIQYIEVEDGKFAMVHHDPCGWHIGDAYPVAE